MSAKGFVVIGGFHITWKEASNNGFLPVASNRLKSSMENPTKAQIEEFAQQIERKFSESGSPIAASVFLS